MKAYKVFTHDLRSPIQGGEPVWGGELPYTLPPREVDTSETECGAGWNACAKAEDALQIVGLWPDGRPSRVFEVEGEPLARGDKLRAATWTITRELREEEIGEAVRRLSKPFGDLADEMTREQMAWRAALARPRRDEETIVRGLRAALDARSLGAAWQLRRFESSKDAWVASTRCCAPGGQVLGDARAAWAAWDNDWAARAVRDAWAARTRDARDNDWAAWAAWDALTVYYTATRGWISARPDLLTVGLRDAYAAGLEIALPVGSAELGWAM